MRALKVSLLLLFLGGVACSFPIAPNANREEWAFIRAAEKRIAPVLRAHERRDAAELRGAVRAERRARNKLRSAEALRHAAEAQLARVSSTEQRIWASTGTASVASHEASKNISGAEQALERAEEHERYAKAIFAEATRNRSDTEESLKKRSERRRSLSAERKALRQAMWRNPSQAVIEQLMDVNTELAHEYGIKSKITWRTVKMKDDKVVPSPGAVLFYQTKRGRERGDTPQSLQGITECDEYVTLGRYYVWAVRPEGVSSKRDRLIYIADYSGPVEIVEDR